MQRTRQGAARRQDLLFGLQRPLEPPQPPPPHHPHQAAGTTWYREVPTKGLPPPAWQDLLGIGRAMAPVSAPALALAPGPAEVGKTEPFRGGGAPGGWVDGWESGSPGATLGKFLPTLELRPSWIKLRVVLQFLRAPGAPPPPLPLPLSLPSGLLLWAHRLPAPGHSSPVLHSLPLQPLPWLPLLSPG